MYCYRTRQSLSQVFFVVLHQKILHVSSEEKKPSIWLCWRVFFCFEGVKDKLVCRYYDTNVSVDTCSQGMQQLRTVEHQSFTAASLCARTLQTLTLRSDQSVFNKKLTMMMLQRIFHFPSSKFQSSAISWRQNAKGSAWGDHCPKNMY